MAQTENTDRVGYFPSELTPPEEKKKVSWGLKYAKAIVSASQILEQSYTNRKDRWENNRKYSVGMNDVDELKRQAIPTENEWMTLEFNVATPVPKDIRVTQESIYSHPYKPKVEIFDSNSHSRMERRKNELLAKMQLSKVVSDLKSEGVIPSEMTFQDLENAPKDSHEIEMYQKTNAKTIEQIAIEKLIRRTFQRCNMPVIERKIVKDLTDIKWVATYTGVDDSGNFYVDYLDPMLTVTSYVEKEDFSDMVWGGHIEYITVGELRERMPNLSNDKILNIMRQNVGRRLKDEYNLELGNRRYFQLQPLEQEGLEGVLIEILVFETLQSDRISYLEKQLSTGGFDIKKRSPEYESPKDSESKNKVHRGVVERIYKGEYIMKTQHMMSWGLKDGVAYKINKGKTINKPLFGYVFYAPDILNMQNKSVVEEIIPHIRKMLILEIKTLHFIALASPPGFAYDISTIVEAIKGMGMKGLKPKNMAEIKAWTGDIYFASRDEMGNPILHPGQKPIEFQQSTLDPAIERFSMLWTHEYDKVQKILGINSAVDGSTPDKRALVGVQEMAVAAHKTTIRNLQTAYLEVIKSIAYRAAYYQQLMIKEGTYTDEMRDLLSEPEFAVLEAKKIGELMFNLEIELAPDAMQKRLLMDRMEVALQQGALGVEDLLMIQRVSDESIEKAEEIFLMRVERRKRDAQEAAMQQQQMKQQEDVLKIQAESQKEAAITELKAQLAEIEKTLEKENIKAKGEEERKSINTEYDRKEGLIKKTAELKAKYGWDKESQVSAPKEAGKVEPGTGIS